MKKIGILTSGGDAPGMNAAIRGVTRAAVNHGMEVIGILRGYEGLLDEDYYPLSKEATGGILQRGGTILKTARSEAFKTPEGLEKAVQNIETAGFDAIVVIGGDGSFRGALELAKREILVIGIPASIDNDMGCTDFTIGFDTAVTTVIDAVGKIKDTATSHDRTTVIEVMGRNCGDIALYAGLTGGAEYIMIPEIEPDIDSLCERIEEGIARGKSHCIILKSEGIDISNEELMDIISKRTGQEARQVVLGYVQRGGAPTAQDRLLATRLGWQAAELIARDEGSRAVVIQNGEILTMELEDAVAVERQADLELLAMLEDLQ